VKFRHAIKLAMAVIEHPAMKLEYINQKGGSHRVAHFSAGGDRSAASQPLTLVAHHGSSDSLLSRSRVVSLFKPIIQMITAILRRDKSTAS
jgi:hypothetical protein